MKFVYDAKTHAVLPQRDSLGRAILLVKAANFDVKRLNDEKIISVANISLQLLVEDPRVQIEGVVMILDLADFSLMQQIRLVNPRSAWIMINFLQDTFPMRLRELHIINTPFFFDALYACFSPFLKEKFRKRVSNKLAK
uniref:Clavesin-1 n=1 Tax=Cacopsylla melanoneura TaxID=428564 RepID=A0A8D9E7S2_9HEMI